MVKSWVDGKDYPAVAKTLDEVRPEFRERVVAVTERAAKRPKSTKPGTPHEEVMAKLGLPVLDPETK